MATEKVWVFTDWRDGQYIYRRCRPKTTGSMQVDESIVLLWDKISEAYQALQGQLRDLDDQIIDAREEEKNRDFDNYWDFPLSPKKVNG